MALVVALLGAMSVVVASPAPVGASGRAESQDAPTEPGVVGWSGTVTGQKTTTTLHGSETGFRLTNARFVLDGSGAADHSGIGYNRLDQPFDYSASVLATGVAPHECPGGANLITFGSGSVAGHAGLSGDQYLGVRVTDGTHRAGISGATDPTFILPATSVANCGETQQSQSMDWVFEAIVSGDGSPGDNDNDEDSGLIESGGTISWSHTRAVAGGDVATSTFTQLQTVTVHLTRLPDRDHDGVPDATDQCPDDPNPTDDGCPLVDDDDGDGVPNDVDQCPDTFPGFPVDSVGCPTLPDEDQDGAPDVIDLCPGTPLGTLVNSTGCPDSDGDDVPDSTDACASDPGSPTALGCPDADGDTFPDPGHNAPGTEDSCPDQPADEGSTDGCPGITAVADWSMPDRTLDTDHNGLIDGYIDGTQSARVPASKLYAVDLDACGSTGVITSYAWTVAGVQHVSPTCRTRITSREGTFATSLTVSGVDGSDTTSFDLKVKDFLIVGMGDSYGSGEGAPVRNATLLHPWPHWDHQPCHRSVRSGQAVSALRLEQADYHSSVTFIHLACSGSTVHKGLLGPYRDPPGTSSHGEPRGQAAQIDDARLLAHGNKIDALILSIGGNDIGFESIITSCARFSHCPSEKRRFNLWAPAPVGDQFTRSAHSLHYDTEEKLRILEGRYDEVARALDGLHVPRSRVFVTEYPNIATGDNGQYCDGLLRPPFDSGIADEELQWASEVAQNGTVGTTFTLDVNLGHDRTFYVRSPGLNVQISGLGALRWTPITGIAERFIGHGYCASDHWVTQFDESVRHQHNDKGTMHPNGQGQQAYAAAITPVLLSALGVQGTP